MKDKLQNELRGMLSGLPDVPVASNFTARVMQAVELEEMRSRRRWYLNWNLRALLPRVAFAAVIAVSGMLAVHQYQLDSRRATFTKSLAMVASAKSLPSVEALKNFDAIARMSQPHADDELLALASEMK